MNMFILMLLCFTVAARPAPSPFELPKSEIRKYFEEQDSDAKANPIIFDRFGTPPDNYPAVIPGENDYYDDNESYPGIWTDNSKDCHSVNNCPGSPADPYAPIFPIGDYPTFPFGASSDREWKCNVEADCFGQDRVPADLANDTQVLFLRSSNFTSLAVGDLDVLPPLIKLRIEYSDLRDIQPRVFGSQPTLQTLELVGNTLTSLAPATFLELAELTSLDLTSNKISEINRAVFRGLDSLKELRLISNSLTQLEDDTFGEMINLESISLEYNNISVIYKYAFRGLAKLRKLYLNHNSIRQVPTLALRVPRTLTNLYLTGNPLRKIFRKDFRGVQNLEELWLDECEISAIAKNTFQGSSLQVLVISDNSLTFLPNLGKMKQLRAVVMEYNPWICDCTMGRTIKWLKRHSIGPESEEPICSAPEHLAGRRALELTSDDLCAQRPYDRMPVIISDDDTKLEGGWAPVVYDHFDPEVPLLNWTPEKSDDVSTTASTSSTAATSPASTAVTRSAPPPPSTTILSTAALTTDVVAKDVTRRDETTTQKPRSSTERRPLRENDVTSRGSSLETTTVAVSHTSSTEGATALQTNFTGRSTIANTTELQETTEEVSTESDRDSKPAKPSEITYSIIAVVGAFLLLAVIGAVVFKVFLSKENNEKGETNSNHRMELAIANGTRQASHEKPTPPEKTDQNGNSHAKSSTEPSTEFSEEGT